MTKLFSLLFLLMVSVMPVHYAAADGLVNCGNGTIKDGRIEDACTVQSLFDTVVTVTNFLIAFAGLIAITMIIYGGLRMITSAGSPAPYAAAKKIMTNAIIGLVIVLFAFMLINTLLSEKFGIGIQGGGNIFKDAVKFIQG